MFLYKKKNIRAKWSLYVQSAHNRQFSKRWKDSKIDVGGNKIAAAIPRRTRHGSLRNSRRPPGNWQLRRCQSRKKPSRETEEKRERKEKRKASRDRNACDRGKRSANWTRQCTFSIDVTEQTLPTTTTTTTKKRSPSYRYSSRNTRYAGSAQFTA